MRTYGTLAKWNDDRGFGFVAPAEGGEEVFVHISAFPNDGQRPRLGEIVSFDIEGEPDGKRRAVNVTRPGRRKPPAREAQRPHARRSRLSVLVIGAVIAAGAVGVYRYTRPGDHDPPTEPPPARHSAQPAVPSTSKCDGRTMCSQMTSCAEATYFIRHCPNTKMDGDGDGVPCERQLCS
ncbi:MAG TPA: cold shock domain-containing protein [Stenotrophomonas sp.]|nr:cold shock domain-containing protein [Stenotrophomonas sp.]